MIPEAVGVASPFWPLPDVTRKRFTFGWARAKGKRHHAGLDFYAPRGSIVVAPEAGTIIGWQRFVGPNSVALLEQTDTGIVILFGEVEPQSWAKHGVHIGSRVRAGQTVAEVGINNDLSQMLHIETYVRGTRRNQRWYKGQAPPSALLDPTRYMRTAEAMDGTQGDTDGDDVDDNGGNDDDINDDQGGDDDDGGDCPPGQEWQTHPDTGAPICVPIATTTPDIHPQDPDGMRLPSNAGLIVLGIALLYDWSQKR